DHVTDTRHPGHAATQERALVIRPVRPGELLIQVTPGHERVRELLLGRPRVDLPQRLHPLSGGHETDGGTSGDTEALGKPTGGTLGTPHGLRGVPQLFVHATQTALTSE